jgi:hypothetical protein
MALPILVGGGLALSKRNENRRKQAASNVYSTKYPLLNECAPMEDSIKSAQAELKIIDASPVNTSGAKRIKKRNSDTLKSWIGVMKAHLKDLTCGINVASTESVAPIVMPSSNMEVPKLEKAPQGSESTADATNDENLPEPNNKKGVNWLLIGGAAIGVLVIFKFMKNK